MTASLTIEQLLSALGRKGIPLPFEMGTFIVLEATEQVLVLEATSETPALPLVGGRELELGEQGEVVVTSTRVARSEADASRALVALLGELLVRSAPGVPTMLLEIVEHGPSDGEWTLLRLRDDLEAALVPLNRGAMRRVLARLLRETRREDRMLSSPPPDADAIDEDLDDLLGIERAAKSRHDPAKVAATPSRAPTPPPAVPSLRLREREGIGGPSVLGEDGLADPSLAAPLSVPPLGRASTRSRAEPAGAARRPLRDLGSVAPHSREADGLDAFEREASGRSSGLRVGLLLVLFAAVLGGGYLVLGRDGVRQLLGLTPQATVPAVVTASKPAKPRPLVGELRVSSTPDRAQVLMLVGTAPAVVTKLPLGVAYEFVALAPGYAPSRAVVPAAAEWQMEAGEPRYELALQLGDATAHHGQDNLGPTRLSGDMGSPKAQLGSVRVITSPPGAKVYQLIGFTPDARVENIEISAPIDLLVYLEGAAPVALHATEADFKPEGAGLVASFSASLPDAKRK
ncbi:MAG: hypothetical protein ACHQ53_04330 [Polyangiales bacterium]